MADDYTVEMRDSDIILSATDGLFDNLFQHEILRIVSDYRFENKDKLWKKSQAEELAQKLTNAAISKFRNNYTCMKTPYQRKFYQCFNKAWTVSKTFYP